MLKKKSHAGQVSQALTLLLTSEIYGQVSLPPKNLWGDMEHLGSIRNCSVAFSAIRQQYCALKAIFADGFY